MKRYYRPLIQFSALVCMVVFSATWTFAATLTSTVDKNQLSSSETLTLIISYDQQTDSSKLDLQPLSEDFDVLGVTPQSSSYVSIVNGQATQQASTIWTVTLAPKRDGLLEIPSFTVDGNRSQSIKIEVSDSGTGVKPIEVRVSADSDSVVPSQQLIVEIEIVAQANVSNLNGPKLIVANADVEPLSEQSFQRTVNGVLSQIVLLRYTVFPDRPGELVIPVMTYSAVQASSPGLPSRFRNRGQRVIARSEQLKVAVKDVPASNGDAWFPAKNVAIDSQWSADKSGLTVGEPITRTVTVRADGQRASLIPPLPQPITSDGFKSYRDKAQLDNQSNEQGVLATRIESEAIVPSVSGELTLPALKVKWWDVNQQQWQTAVLASETLTVAPAVAGAASDTQLSPAQQSSSDITTTTRQISSWAWPLFSLIFALICLVQFWIIFRLRRLPSNNAQPNLTNHNETDAWKAVKKSLREADPANIRQCLLRWARAVLPASSTVSLQQLLSQSDNDVVISELRRLDEQLYKGGNQFNAANLAGEIGTLRRAVLDHSSATEQKDNVLAPLYKQ